MLWTDSNKVILLQSPNVCLENKEQNEHYLLKRTFNFRNTGKKREDSSKHQQSLDTNDKDVDPVSCCQLIFVHLEKSFQHFLP